MEEMVIKQLTQSNTGLQKQSLGHLVAFRTSTGVEEAVRHRLFTPSLFHY